MSAVAGAALHRLSSDLALYTVTHHTSNKNKNTKELLFPPLTALFTVADSSSVRDCYEAQAKSFSGNLVTIASLYT